MVAAATYLHHGAVLGLEQPVEALDLLRCSFLVNRHLQQAARQCGTAVVQMQDNLAPPVNL